MPEYIDLVTWDEPVMRRALATRDISAVYALLVAAGVPQRVIAEATGQSQGEVSEILAGRRVLSYGVLVRVATGFGIPRGWMGLAYSGVNLTDDNQPTEEVDENMKRRVLLATASLALFDRPILGEVLELPARPESPTPLPSRLVMADVDAISNLTEQLRLLARQYGGQGETVSAIAVRSMRLLSVDASDDVRGSLHSALAELHTVAGWCCFDSAVSADVIRAHFARGAELATRAGDTYRAVDALYHAAMAMQHEAPNDALKMLQLVQFRLGQERSDHPRTGTLSSWLHADSARCLISLNRPDQARSSLAAARDAWDPGDRFDQADMDHVTAQAYRGLGRLDLAEQLAASSVRVWGEQDRRDSVQAATTLAAIHVDAGEPDGLTLAGNVIRDVASLRSGRARAKLCGLADVLAARPDGSSRELAVHARRVAAART
ncbi:MAG: helix-turn-helix domain-containing protein [Pseudonocardiaceae bacterium]